MWAKGFLLLAVNIAFVTANFPADPIAVEVINITDTNPIGTVTDCQAVIVATSEHVQCGSKGIISSRGTLPVNMW